MKKTLLLLPAIIAAVFLLFSCPPPGGGGSPVAVTVTDMSTHYRVVIDVGDGNHYEIGREYARKMLQVVPDWEVIVDSYIAEMAFVFDYTTLLSRAADITPQIPQAYKDELEGFYSMLPGTTVNAAGDGKVSKDELYLINLIPDIIDYSACSAVSVFGGLSSIGSTITGRNLDWADGVLHEFARLQAVVIIKNGSRSISLIGCLGFLGAITAVNDNGVFGAILLSPLLGYDSSDKRSYAFDLRHALENYSTMDQVAAYMADGSREYAFGHLIFLSDATGSKVVENDITQAGNRPIRSYSSSLNAGVAAWPTPALDYSIGAVNSFVYDGNTDNHTGDGDNTSRWASMISELSAAADAGSDDGTKITVDELKSVISFDNGDGPDSMSTGDLYNSSTKQCIIFQPQTMDLEIYFIARNGTLADDPVFEAIDLDF